MSYKTMSCFPLLIIALVVAVEGTNSISKHATNGIKEKTEAASKQRQDRSAIRYNFLKWSKGVVPYVLQAGAYSDDYKNNILSAMRQIEDNTKHGSTYCVRFRQKTASDYDFIDIKKQSSCFSPTGRIRSPGNVVSLGWSCNKVGTIMHEMMHTLGFIHEQRRPDRDDNIDIIWDNVQSSNKKEYELYPSGFIATYGIPYDFTSIMQYSPYGYAIDPSKPTMVPKRSRIGKHVQMGFRSHMSVSDVMRVQAHYGCTKDVSHIQSPDPSQWLINCDFEDGNICDFKQADDDDFDWQIGSGPTPTTGTGPEADHTNAIGSYAYAEANGHHGMKARLVSKEFPPGTYCLTYWMFLYGKDGGAFNIFAHKGNDPEVETTQRNYWSNEEEEIRNLAPWTLVLEYVVGNGDRSDFALDDIRLRPGSC